MKMWYSAVVTAMSIIVVILFPMQEYRDYVMFGFLVFIISINRWESDRILKSINNKSKLK